MDEGSWYSAPTASNYILLSGDSWIHHLSSYTACGNALYWIAYFLAFVDSTRRDVFSATSAPSVTPAPTPLSFRLKVLPPRKMLSSTSARYVREFSVQYRDIESSDFVACCIRLPGKEGYSGLKGPGDLGVRCLKLFQLLSHKLRRS